MASVTAPFFDFKTISMAASIRNNYLEKDLCGKLVIIVGRLKGEETSEVANAELIALIAHRLREPLGPTLLALQLLVREEQLSPQGIDLIRMLQRSIKQEVRAITELLALIRTFLEERNKRTPEDKSEV